jgi:uncharacterized protein (TIGR02646 family)
MHKLDRPIAPTCLSNYRHGQHNWDDVSPADKSQIWQQLVVMQQNYCAYCECEIVDGRKHIEHFRQKSSGRYPQGTFRWDNLFGSCNENDSCGKHKDNCGIYNHQDLIKMDVEDPDAFFLFVEDGSISFLPGLSAAKQHRAEETLRIFNLDEKYGRLRHMRQSAVLGYKKTVEEFLEMAQHFDDADWRPILNNELNRIRMDEPFSTAIIHLFVMR